MQKLKLTFVGEDEFSCPTYKDQFGKYWKNTNFEYSSKSGLSSVLGNDPDGEPNESISSDIEVEFVGEPEPCPCKFEISMFFRLVADCKYYLGAGGRYEGNLWGQTVEGHINAMREYLSKIPEKWQGETVNEETIKMYEQEMLGKEGA